MRDQLHGEDIVLWSERQAGALRGLADRHPDAGVDWARVIDMVESAGRGLLHEVEAETVRALYWHLMLAAHPRAANRRGWPPGGRGGAGGRRRPHGGGGDAPPRVGRPVCPAGGGGGRPRRSGERRCGGGGG